MQIDIFRLKQPMRIGSPVGGSTLDTIAMRKRPDGDAEPNLHMVEMCARNLVKMDGSPVTLAELLSYYVDEGFREAVRRAFAAGGLFEGIPA